MVNNLLRDNKEQKYILFDTESENLRLLGKNRAWQISYLIAEGDKIKEFKDHYLWWDDLEVSDGAAKVTGFDYNKYKEKAKPPGPILEELNSYLYNPEYIVMGHNLMGFDVYVLQNSMKSLDKNFKNDWSYLDRLIDTMSVAKMVKLGVTECKRENWRREMFRFGDYFEKNMKVSITAMAKEFEIDFDPEKLHNSLYDIEINWKIWQKLKYLIDI